MARVCWVTDEVPDVDGTGGAVRQYHLLRAVAADHDVELVVAGRPPSEEVRSWVSRLDRVDAPPPRPDQPRWRTLASVLDPEAEDVRGGRPARRRLRALVADRPRVDVVVVQHAWLAPLVRLRRPGERWVLDLHNVPSAKTRHLETTASTWRGRAWVRAELAKTRRGERSALASYDVVVVPSDEDAVALGRSPRVCVVGNGVDPDRFSLAPPAPEPQVVFTGHLHYPPNVDAMRWFCRDAWPIVLAAVPDARLDIVGHAPSDEILGLDGTAGIRVHADVPTVVPFIRAARVAVVPVRIGSGTRLKALEALACGRALVGTRVGLEGLGIVDGVHARVRDAPGSFGQAVAELLADGDLAAALGAAGRQHVAERFDWRRLAVDFASIVAHH